MAQPGIILICFGLCDQDVIAWISDDISRLFQFPVYVVECNQDFSEYYNPGRRQYDANKILEYVSGMPPRHAVKTIGLLRIDLYIPEWGTGASGRIYHNSVSPEKNDSNPVGFYIQAETLEDRMKYMEILAQVFIAFPVFGFGTDLERARMAQILYFLHTLKEQIPESIFPGSRAFREFGLFPKLCVLPCVSPEAN